MTLLATSCTSPDQYRKAIEDRDAEITRLRQERSMLKSEGNRLAMELSATGAQLREASMQLKQAPVAAPERNQALAQETGLSKLGVGYASRDGVTVITIPSKISFASGKIALSTEGKAALKEVARVLRRNHSGSTYSIEGHTDTDPISKSKFTNNRDLSLQRATAVLTYLVEDCEVADDNCVVVGHGQYRPLNSGTSDSAKAQNRRVEIVVYEGS